MAAMNSAPIYEIAPRDVVAVEHPMIVKNLENGLKTFGNGPAFSRILDSDSMEACIPLYLRINDPLCGAILSRNTPTDNILLKITVPKRTGRKRKRGSHGLFTGDFVVGDDSDGKSTELGNIQSQSRRDSPAELLRSLEDNVGRYEVEAVASIEQTHRFRGLADFHHSTSTTEFGSKIRKVVSAPHMDIFRQLEFNPSMGWKRNEELIPPPSYTVEPLPVNWAWQQNKHSTEEIDHITGKPTLTNRARPKLFQVEHISGSAETVPTEWPYDMPNDPNLQSLVVELNKAFDERPIWTRRALINRINDHPQCLLFASSLHYLGYQFKSGPYRDCIVKYGIDPRTDKKYRMYQTMHFHTLGHELYDKRRTMDLSKKRPHELASHIFDGRNLVFDGKVWQLCDITEPILASIIANAPLRDEYNVHDGHYQNGTWAKVRGIMKVQLLGILYKVAITKEHLESALKIPDIVDNKSSGRDIIVPFPNFEMTEKEIIDRLARGEKNVPVGKGLRKKAFIEKDRRRARIAKQLSKSKPAISDDILGGTTSNIRMSIETNNATISQVMAPIPTIEYGEGSISESVPVHGRQSIHLDGEDYETKDFDRTNEYGGSVSDTDLEEYEQSLAEDDFPGSEDEASENESGEGDNQDEEELNDSEATH